MAWVTPSTVATGDVLTAATWNQSVQANAVELAPFFSAWTAYTPTWAGITVGNGTQENAYLKVGRLVFVRMRLTFGSSTSVTSNPSFTLPVTAASYFDDVQYATIATCALMDGGTAYNGFLLANTTTTVNLATLAGTGIDADKNMVLVSSSAPFTWGTGDSFSAHFFYEAAS